MLCRVLSVRSHQSWCGCAYAADRDHGPCPAWGMAVLDRIASCLRCTQPITTFPVALLLERLWETQAHITRDGSITAV